MKARILFFTICAAVSFIAPHAMGQGHGDIIQISTEFASQGEPQVAYNPNTDEYLVVWQDYRNGNYDIYGQFVQGDGTLRGQNFPICTATGDQKMPHVACDPISDRFMVVFMDKRNGDLHDIYGCFVGNDGEVEGITASEPDGAIPICTNPADVYSCSVAFNYLDEIYLVVWGDHRNYSTNYYGADVFGQRITHKGTLLGSLDPTGNFPIADNPDYDEDAVDVTYSEITNEWLVVYGTSIGYVYAQRVNDGGQILNQQGNVITKPMLQYSGFPVSGHYYNRMFCLSPVGESMEEYFQYRYIAVPKALADYTEYLVMWTGTVDLQVANDVWCQRVGFFREGDKFEAKYIDVIGSVTQQPSAYSVCTANGLQAFVEVAYGKYDNEYVAAWDDPRTLQTMNRDLYCQRLWINGQDQLIMLADDRVNTVTSTENILLNGTSNYEGSGVGIAHNSYRNNFLLAYTYGDLSETRKSAVSSPNKIHARIVYGTTPSKVDEQAGSMMPKSYAIGQNYPNPFNSETVIPFVVKSPTRVTIKVYDLLGHEVRTLIDDHYLAGRYSIRMNSSGFTSGVYIYTVQMGDFKAAKKMVVME